MVIILVWGNVGFSQNKRFNLPGETKDTVSKNVAEPQIATPVEQNKVAKKKPKLQNPTETFWNRTFTGGGFGLSFGNITVINLSPQLGYRVTEKFSVGVGATYIYYNNSYYRFSTNMYGGRVFARYLVWKGLFVHAEDEMLNLQAYDQFNSRVWVNSAMLGAGYQQSLGGNSSIYIMGLFNFTQSKYSPYSNPIIRFGFNIGL